MASQIDLDQSGTFRQFTRVNLGPSVGWIDTPMTVILPVTVGGTTVVQLGNTLIAVNFNGAVTIQLPKAKAPSVIALAQPALSALPPIVVIDVGGFAQANPITILPAAGEAIDGQASVQIASNFGSFTLQPDVVHGSWILVQ